MSQSDQESCFILAMKWVLPTCQGMSISLSRQAKSALLLENANHAFPDSANPSRPLSPSKLKCISCISVTCLTCDFQVWKCPVRLLLPTRHYQQQLLCLIGPLTFTQTHLPVGPSVQGVAGCLLSCLGLWGHLGQWFFAKEKQNRGEISLLSHASQNKPPKHFLWAFSSKSAKSQFS